MFTIATVCTVIIAILAALERYVRPLVHNATASGILGRAVAEVSAAVHEVDQTYVDAIKAASADGVLTDAERREAKAKAIAVARANIGVVGLRRLGRIVGLEGVERWIGTWVERTLAGKRQADAAATGGAALGPLVLAPVPPVPPASSPR